ncbi:unnamed protein product [Moneuplotes crassus]|uniref:Cyclic nucleotide-binding domain-containing protein n=1 Tax=Euplotes crassus TaxID=5936 RepID=A0AAD1ULF2_EUPCR|nr:unnamed protein product [Moneuplotes crassus]
MEPGERRKKFLHFEAASEAIQLQKAANDDSDPFPEIEIEEEKNPILRSMDEISSSSQDYSSDSSEEEKEFHIRDAQDKPRYRKSKVRRSILKSQYLTNKRQSRGSKYLGSRKNSKNLNKNFEIKAGPEGRLPIRRPSNADILLKQNIFNEQKSNLSVLSRVKNQILHPDKREEKGELDYIAVDENRDKEDLNSFLSRSLLTNKFQLVWAFILFIAHTYNLVVLFYYLGIPDFPQDVMLGLQNFFEFILIIDIALRFLIKSFTFEVWESMWLLHDYFAFSSKLGFILTVISSFPFMFLVSCSTSNLAVQSSFWVACMRIPKIIRIREVNKIFSNYSRAEKSRSGSSSFFVAAYSLFLATHIIGCIWLIVGRLDPDEDNWQKMDNFDQNPRNVQQYIEACFFTVATMTGLGYGNVVPTTDLEIFVIIFIMVTGASIYANFFANFIVTMNNRNAKTIEKMKKHDQAKNFGNELNLPEIIMMKIRYYYNELSINYGDIYDRYSNLKELPTSLSTELSCFLNSNLIKSVKMFQFSHPMFILSVARAMMPKICMANDFVLELGNIAEEMLFIKKGVVEILATDNQTIIAYLTEGSYFGEIGLLLTGVRTVSVRAKTLCIFFMIDKDGILKILERFPEQKAFLKSVGRQRLQTTNPEDLKDDEEAEINNLLANQSLLEDINNEIKLDEESKFSKIQSMANLSMQIKNYKKRKDVKLPWNVTKHYPILDKFIVIPFSLLFYIWAIMTITACAYVLFIVPFSISYEYHFDAWLIPIDVIFQIILAFDIFITMKTALNKKFEISVDLKEIAIDYMDTRIFFDILAVFPLDYILMIFGVNQQTVAWVRILRILKLYKPFDYIKIWRKHSNVKIALFTLFLLSILFVIISHLMGCIYFYIGRHEDGGENRYDGQSLFKNTLDRDFLILQPVVEMSIFEQYVHFFYLSACTMGAVMYGDMIPLTPLEQIFTFGAMFTARIYLAFLYAEAAAYLSSVNSAYSSRLKVKSTIGKNPELNALSFDMKKRVYNYHEILGNNFKGVTESQVLNDLPESIEKQIKDNLFKDLIRNITLFPKDDTSAIAALIWRLDLHLLSNGEYVIKDGEIADCMYFIIRGKVEVIKSGVTLAVLEQGAHFGEMALAEGKPTTRAASARCITSCSVGSLSIKNFNILCEFYPIFKSKIQEEVSKRKEDLKKKTENLKEGSPSSIKKTKTLMHSSNNLFRNKSRTSNKGSRQSAYEVSDADGHNVIKRERLSVFDAPSVSKSKKSSFRSEDRVHIERIKSQVNQLLDNEENSKNNNDQVDESQAPLVIQENPNIPDGKVIANPRIYDDGDEESHQSDADSKKCSKGSESSLERKKNKLEGETEVKISIGKFRFIREILQYVSWTRLFEVIVLLFVLYNLIFIPLQGAYRIEYSPALIVMEIFTIIVYSFEIYMLFLKHKELKIEIHDQENNIEESDRHIQDFNAMKKSLKMIRFRIFLSIVSIMPLTIIFQFCDLDEPLLIIFYL